MPRKTVSRKEVSRKRSESPAEGCVSAFFLPLAEASLSSSCLSGGEEARLQQMRMELGTVVSRRVELLSREDKLVKAIKRLSRAVARKHEPSAQDRHKLLAPPPEEPSYETLFTRRLREGSENEPPLPHVSTNSRWRTASLEVPELVDELAAAHSLAADSDADDFLDDKESRQALEARDKLKTLMKESNETALEEGLENMYTILSSSNWASSSIDPRLNRTLRRCARDISQLDLVDDKSESIRIILSFMIQLSLRGAETETALEDSHDLEEVKHWLVADEKPNAEADALTSFQDYRFSCSPRPSSDSSIRRMSVEIPSFEIPSLHLDISIPESPSSRHTATKPPAKSSKQVIVDLTISPESVPTEFRDGSDSQRLGSIPSSISNGPALDESLPEGCFVYDPDIVETYEMPGKKRKFFNDVSTLEDWQVLQPIPEGPEGDEGGADHEFECNPPEQLPIALPLSSHVQAPCPLSLKDLDRMMQNDNEPDFNALSELDLKLAAKRYGLKNMRRSALVKVLQSIWRNQRNQLGVSSTISDNEPMQLSQDRQKGTLDPDAVVAFIRDSWDLYEKVLTFQPIDLDDLHVAMASKGLSISKPKLRGVLDELNIFLTYGQQNPSSSTSRKRRAPPPSR